MTTPTQQGTTIVAAAIKYATAQVGKPYIWGGTGPTGYDCSGLLYMAYRSAGYTNITRTTHTMVSQGTALDPATPVNARPPGVLIFPDAGHVYMALGNGQVVEAAHTGVPIRIIHDYTPRAYAIRQLVPVDAVALGGGNYSTGNAVPAGLVGDAVGTATGVTPDAISHWVDVLGNWLTYISLIVVGGVVFAVGLMWVGEQPAKFVRKAVSALPI